MLNLSSNESVIAMSFDLTIPQPGGLSLDLSVTAGETLFVLGANGTGKSNLMQRFYSNHQGNARRMSAHRQTWFDTNRINLSPERRRNNETNIRNYDAESESRWRDSYSSHRPNMAIYDLIDAENVRARLIARAVDLDNIDRAKAISKEDAPIKIINELLSLSNIPIQISVLENDQVVARKSNGEPYSVSQLSDGKRNALLVAVDVLTAKPGTLILIDEPTAICTDLSSPHC